MNACTHKKTRGNVFISGMQYRSYTGEKKEGCTRCALFGMIATDLESADGLDEVEVT